MNQPVGIPVRFGEWTPCQDVQESAQPARTKSQTQDEPIETITKRAFSVREQPVCCADERAEVVSELNKTLSGTGDLEIFGAELCVAFFGEDERIASGSDMGIIKLWDERRPDHVEVLKGHYNGWVNAITLAASPDRKRIASGGEDARLKIWNLASDETLTIPTLDKPVHSVCFKADGKGVFFGLADGSICLWNWTTRDEARQLHMFKEHSKWVYSVQASRDGRKLASGSGDGSLRVWDIEEGRTTVNVATLDMLSAKVYSTAFGHDGNSVVFGLSDGRVGVWLLDENRIRTMAADPHAIWGVACHPTEPIAALGLSKGDIVLWNWATSKKKTLRHHTSTVWSVAFNRNGSRLVSGSADETLKLWNLGDDPQEGEE